MLSLKTAPGKQNIRCLENLLSVLECNKIFLIKICPKYNQTHLWDYYIYQFTQGIIFIELWLNNAPQSIMSSLKNIHVPLSSPLPPLPLTISHPFPSSLPLDFPKLRQVISKNLLTPYLPELIKTKLFYGGGMVKFNN